MKAAGCLLAVLVCIGVGIGFHINSHVSSTLNVLKNDVAQHWESAMPLLKRRYQSLDPLIQAYEKSLGWENGVFTGNPRRFNQQWEMTRPGGMEMTKLAPELEQSEAVRQGLIALNGKGAPISHIEGADSVERSLMSFVAAADRSDAVEVKTLLRQFKADFGATDKEAASKAEEVNAAVARYNEALRRFPNSYLGVRQGFEPIGEFHVVGVGNF